MNLNERELGAVLAGLRVLVELRVGPGGAIEVDPDLYVEIEDEIATGGGNFPVLGRHEINDLCERLNTTPDPPEWAFDTVMELAESAATEILENYPRREYLAEAIGYVQNYLHQNKIWR